MHFLILFLYFRSDAAKAKDEVKQLDGRKLHIDFADPKRKKKNERKPKKTVEAPLKDKPKPKKTIFDSDDEGDGSDEEPEEEEEKEEEEEEEPLQKSSKLKEDLKTKDKSPNGKLK